MITSTTKVGLDAHVEALGDLGSLLNQLHGRIALLLRRVELFRRDGRLNLRVRLLGLNGRSRLHNTLNTGHDRHSQTTKVDTLGESIDLTGARSPDPVKDCRRKRLRGLLRFSVCG